MYSRTATLSRIMGYYGLDYLYHGAREDKLGDAFEDYTVEVLSSNTLLKKAQSGQLNLRNTDEYIFNEVYDRMLDYSSRISSIKASRDIEHRITGGNPKTDVIVDIEAMDGRFSLPISVKQTTAEKVAMAEFDVNTIVREIHITDRRLIELMEKHQRDASAKYFTAEQKEELFNRLAPYRKEFVRWVITGTPKPSKDLRYPELLLKFQLDKADNILDIDCFSPEEYVDTLIYDRYGNVKKGGFGTGLGWTYATGSKGQKIQFKG